MALFLPNNSLLFPKDTTIIKDFVILTNDHLISPVQSAPLVLLINTIQPQVLIIQNNQTAVFWVFLHCCQIQQRNVLKVTGLRKFSLEFKRLTTLKEAIHYRPGPIPRFENETCKEN